MATIQLSSFMLGLPIWYLPTPGVAPTIRASNSNTVKTGPFPPSSRDPLPNPKGKGKKENEKKLARSEQPASDKKAGGKKTASCKAANPLPTADQVGSTPSVDNKTDSDDMSEKTPKIKFPCLVCGGNHHSHACPIILIVQKEWTEVIGPANDPDPKVKVKFPCKICSGSHLLKKCP